MKKSNVKKYTNEDIIKIVEGYAKSTITQTIKEYIERIGISRSHFNTCVKKYKMLFPKKAKRIEKGISTRSKRAKSKAISKAHKKKKEYITVTGLLSKRGWTPNMVNRLLEKLEYKEVRNPYFSCASPMKLYDLKDIKRIEKTKKFEKLKEEANKRKMSAKRAQETKKEKIKKMENETMKLVDEFSILVKRISIEELEVKTLEYKRKWFKEHPKVEKMYIDDYEYDDDYSFYEYENAGYLHDFQGYFEYVEIYNDVDNVPEEVKKRWMVSYIRHHLTNYDEELEKIKGRKGEQLAYEKYRRILAEEIKKVYPELEKEIDKYMLKNNEHEKGEIEEIGKEIE